MFKKSCTRRLYAIGEDNQYRVIKIKGIHNHAAYKDKEIQRQEITATVKRNRKRPSKYFFQQSKK